MVTALVVEAGTNVLVTGASSGIGASLARTLAERGATVGVVGRRADKLEAVRAACGEQARAWVVDLGDLDAAEGVVNEAWEAFGHLDVLVNNAAVPKRRPAERLVFGEVEETMRVNFLSPARMTLAVLGRMLTRGGGTVVNVSSVGGRLGIGHEAAYCASKFALVGWSEALAIDLDGTGVKIRLINPGPVDTDIWDRPGEDPAVFVPDLESPDRVAEGIVAAIEGDTFEHYLPDMKAVIDFKNSDVDGFIKMNAEFVRSQSAAVSKETP